MRWVQFGAVSPVMRMQRNGVAFPEKDRPAGRGRRPDRELAPVREAAHAALPLPRGGRPRLPQDGHCRSCGTSRSSIRTTSARARARTSTCSGRTCWRRRWSSRARPSASCTCRRAAGSTSGARSRTGEKRGGLRLRPRARARGRPRGDGARAARGAAADGPRRRRAAAAAGGRGHARRRTGRGRTRCRCRERRGRLDLIAFPPRALDAARSSAGRSCGRSSADGAGTS